MALRPGAVGEPGGGEALPAEKKRRRRPLEMVERAEGTPPAPPVRRRARCARGGKGKVAAAAGRKVKAAERPGRERFSPAEHRIADERERLAGQQEQMERWQAQMLSAEGRIALAEELLKVRAKNGRLVPLVANAVQRRYEQESGREDMVLKARQMGMSTWIAGQFLLRTVLEAGSVTLQVAHTREAAMGLFRMVQRMHAHLPDVLRLGVAKLGRKSKTEMTFPAIDSEIRIASAGEENAGRGLTVTNLHLSEVARWQGDAGETLAGLRAALAPDGRMVMESTPNGAYGCFFAEWRTAERRGAVRHFFPWWMEPGYRSAAATELDDEELALGLDAEQIGFRRELRERFGALAVQEFAEDAVTCFRESGSCFFEAGAVAARLLEAPAAMETRWNGALRVWLPPMAGRGYVLAADPAGGGAEGDFCAVQVVDEATGVQCAEVQVRLAPRMFAGKIAELAREFCNALVVVERNNHGAAVLAFLGNERGLRVYAGVDGEGGFLTTTQSRAAMLAGLNVMVSTRTELFLSARLLEECRTFVVKDGGRTEAAAGAHDDLVLAMAMAQAVRRG